MIQAVFQNNSFFVCDKPAQVLSVPGREKNDERRCLGTELQAQLKRQVFPVHRLDFEVSGLIMFALDAKAHKTSQDWFQHKKIQKIYHAESLMQNFAHWPADVPTDRSALNLEVEQEFYWKMQILRGKRRSFESENGEWAETRAKVLGLADGKVQWELRPLTGKSHQLRLELSRHGFPILGDRLYGSQVPGTYGPGISLRAVQLDLSAISDRLGLPAQISSSLK